ncbi:MAG: hypothetical protein L0H15_00925 [Nitrosospira sp.]|nr:hypothetical protein [Nitrosospira sp.]MDN5934911.1 hypothetical protein [Nitrosospira sp.]
METTRKQVILRASAFQPFRIYLSSVNYPRPMLPYQGMAPSPHFCFRGLAGFAQAGSNALTREKTLCAMCTNARFTPSRSTVLIRQQARLDSLLRDDVEMNHHVNSLRHQISS